MLNKKDRFQTYSEKQIHFIDDNISDILVCFLRDLDKKLSIIDLGCGDGRFFYMLSNKGLLKDAEKIVGLDLSKERIKRMKIHCPFVDGLIADISNIEQIKDNSFDLIISSQVIEHITEDLKMVKDIYRIIRPNGHLYISTVIKKWYGFWVHYNKGFKLDPTHVKEYRYKEEFLDLLNTNGFDVIKYNVNDINYSIIDLIIRTIIKFDLIKPRSNFYLEHNILNRIRPLINIRIIGYQNIEVLCKASK